MPEPIATPLELTHAQVDDASHGHAPLIRVTLPQTRTPVWLAARYDVVKAALGDSRFVRDPAKVAEVQGGGVGAELLDGAGLPPEYRQYLEILVMVDGPEHTRLRTHVMRAFAPRRIAALRPRIERIAGALTDELAAKGSEFDLLSAFAYPLMTNVICEIIGVEEADRPKVGDWIRDYESGEPDRFLPGIDQLAAYIDGLLDRRAAEPAEDLASDLLRSSGEAEEGQRLTRQEMIALVFLLINTGIAPPAFFTTDAVLALLDHPQQLARLRAEPGLLPRAVQELLRYVSAVRVGATLYATEDVELGGVLVRRGEGVTSGLLAANRDPGTFGDPGRLDLTREAARGGGHIAYGHGAHRCIGAALANLQTEVILEELLLRREGLTLAIERGDLQRIGFAGDGTYPIGLPVRF
ncbi:cytochrome P450 [Streptomyces albiflavescens]|uniref:Cytochrome P450 n=1 Tax=Streptomyces albiflavescens TaxID=1623582 RepID=A0A917YE32_9ACTN|nr:cytochrome P450 [Streptomyces albiflavescens]GGN85343.1 cytochrome P450 [Streptomyces albiflavescens]